MRRATALLAVALLLGGTAAADVLVLKNGRKVAGSVKEKDGTYIVQVEGEELAFPKEEVALWAKKPQDLLGGAAQLVEEAKALYLEAVNMTDARAADEKFREALPRVTRAREAYAEARELFPDGYSDLDEALVNIMKLLRLVRERIGSDITRGGPAPVTPKGKPAPPAPKPDAPPVAGPIGEPVVAALAVASSVEKRADKAQREAARASLDPREGPTASRAFASALGVFLLRDDKDWRLVFDRVYVRTPRSTNTWTGRLVKRPDGSTSLLTGTHEVRLRSAPDGGMLVTPPGGTEFKPAECKIDENVKSDALAALDEYFKSHGIDGAHAFTVERHVQEAQFLVDRAKAARAKDASAFVDALLLFAAAHLDVALASVAPDAKMTELVKSAGWLTADWGRVVGPAHGIAMASYHRWTSVGLYDMAIVEFAQSKVASPDPAVRYATGMLYLYRALAVNRQYDRAHAFFTRFGNEAPDARTREHLMAVAKSIRLAAPCRACEGTREVRCRPCRGAGKADFQCATCGGAGTINRGLGGDQPCGPCKGTGTLKDMNCPKCKATGKLPCKARGCVKPVSQPSIESIIETAECADCAGRGVLFERVALPCAGCLGLGVHVRPAADPSKTLR